MVLADFHEGLRTALSYWTWAAIFGVLAVLVHYTGKHFEKKYPHLKPRKKEKKSRRKKD